MAGETPTYPKRPSHYAHKVVRAMVKTCVAQEHGQGVFLLVCVIAHTEDARHYTSAVTFWNEQLAHVTGFANVKAMDRQRAKAVESGWLVYIPGGKSKPGKYWVQVPSQFQNLDDAPSDEGEMQDDGKQFVTPLATSNLTNKVGREPGDNRELSGVTTGKEPGDKWATFNPVPNPVPVPDVASATSVIVTKEKPKPRQRFIPPTVEEVRAYCQERGNQIDPERFVDTYASQGWKKSNGVPVVDWKGCVRTWEKNDADRRFGGTNQAGVLSAAGIRPGGGVANREQARETANLSAIAGFLQSAGVRESDGGAHHAQKNLGFHREAVTGVALRSAAVPGGDDQSIGGRASNVGNAIPGVGRPVSEVPRKDAQGLLPDG